MNSSLRNEERIAMEIIVDCCNETEAWSGWLYHLESKLTFPFQAECIRMWCNSPLKVEDRALLGSTRTVVLIRPRQV